MAEPGKKKEVLCEMMLDDHPNWTVLGVESDMLAIKVIHAMHQIGRRVPKAG